MYVVHFRHQLLACYVIQNLISEILGNMKVQNLVEKIRQYCNLRYGHIRVSLSQLLIILACFPFESDNREV